MKVLHLVTEYQITDERQERNKSEKRIGGKDVAESSQTRWTMERTDSSEPRITAASM